MKQIIAIVVVYHPNVDILINNINQYIDNITKLIVWENTILSNREKNLILNGVWDRDKIIFEGNGINKGIAYPVNQAIKTAFKEKCEYILTMDQDSTWINFEDYIKAVHNIAKIHDDIMIFGPKTLNAFQNENYKSSSGGFDNVDYVITSGALYRTEVFEKIGDFYDDMFIDGVDEEICFRASRYGYGTVVVKSGCLIQHFGEPSKVRFLNKNLTTPNYSAFRYYYIVRNHLWLSQQKWINKTIRKVMFRNYVLVPPIKILLFENNKFKKILAVLRAIKDGRRKELRRIK